MNTFQLQGLTLEYVDQPYNRARQNERALEVGAVLPHYLPATLAWLFGWVGLPVPETVDIYDGNEKYG